MRARVCNLCEYGAHITVDSMRAAVVAAFAREYGAYETVSEAVFDPARLAAAEERHASWEWRMGATPAFNLTLETRFPWGGLELAFVLQNGVVQEARAWSDAMDEAFIRALPDALLGAPLTGAALAAAVQRLGRARWPRTLPSGLKRRSGQKSRHPRAALQRKGVRRVG